MLKNPERELKLKKLHAGEIKMSKKARVFIVGLDGATFDLILPCMHGNKLRLRALGYIP